MNGLYGSCNSHEYFLLRHGVEVCCSDLKAFIFALYINIESLHISMALADTASSPYRSANGSAYVAVPPCSIQTSTLH